MMLPFFWLYNTKGIIAERDDLKSILGEVKTNYFFETKNNGENVFKKAENKLR